MGFFVTMSTVVEQNTDRFYGCIPLEKSNTLVVEGGAPATLEYQLRDPAGIPIDLSDYFCGDPSQEINEPVVKFALADNSRIAKKEEPAVLTDIKNGKIQIELPEYVWGMPCIYSFHVAVRDIEKHKPKYISRNKGTLLVEWTPFVDSRIGARVVPALEDVRRKLDDFVGKNNLLQQVEFSADDIVNAMILPVQQFNETPPKLRNYNYSVANFPYYENWVLGTAAELLRIATVHYVRNKLVSTHGGIQGDEQARDHDYTRLAKAYKEEYVSWVRFEKHQLNYSRGQGWGTVYSDYHSY
jgi:hypothetical protein